MKTKVIVATYEHRHGTDIRVFDSFEKAQVWKDEIGAEWWSEVSDDTQPEDPCACGDEYFERAEGEWFNVEECEVE